MIHPPKLIQLLQKQGYIAELFETFNLNEDLLPLHQREGRYTKLNEVYLGLHKSERMSIYQSPFFKYFLMEFGVNSDFIFDHIEDFCTNETHTKASAWLMSGKVSRKYLYLEEETMTSIMVNKTAPNYSAIRIWKSTKTAKPKANIEIDLTLEGVLRLGTKICTSNYGKPKNYAPGELEATREWKNIELFKEQGRLQFEANKEVLGMFECAIEESEKELHIVYMATEIRETLLSHQLQLGANKVKLSGHFKRHSDHAVILKSIHHIELLKI